ncbi:MAG: hypothetical protein U0T73_06325 [Chitinophagales bacterium]
MRKFLFPLSVASLLLLGSCDKEPMPKGLASIMKYDMDIQLAYQPGANPNPACLMDFDAGRVYTIEEAKDSFGAIDLIWAARTVDHSSYIFSPKVYEGSAGLGTDFSKIDFHADSWAHYDSARYSAPTVYKAAQAFSEIGNYQDLDNFISDQTITGYNRRIMPDEVGKTFCFITSKNKQGAFQITNIQYGPHGYMTISVRVER